MKKMEMEAYLDDNVIIPEDIKKMTIEELEKAIEEFENEYKLKKNKNS